MATDFRARRPRKLGDDEGRKIFSKNVLTKKILFVNLAKEISSAELAQAYGGKS